MIREACIEPMGCTFKNANGANTLLKAMACRSFANISSHAEDSDSFTLIDFLHTHPFYRNAIKRPFYRNAIKKRPSF